MGRLDIDDRVESVPVQTADFPRRLARSSVLQRDAVVCKNLFRRDSSRVQCNFIGCSVRVEIARPTAMTTAHFEDIFSAQFHLRGDVMIKLDAGAVRFVAGRERDAHRRFFLIGVVEKQNFLAVQPSREKWIPKLPDGLANPADRKQMINERQRNFYVKCRRKPIRWADVVGSGAKLLHADDFGGLACATEGELRRVARFFAKELFAQRRLRSDDENFLFVMQYFGASGARADEIK